MNDQQKTNLRIIFALTGIHFIGDFYASWVNPLLPVFVDKFALSLTQVGLITALSRLLAFVVQPSVGYIADRSRTRIFILGGPLLAMTFIPLVGVAPSFWLLLVFISLGSIGSSMFHPTCAGMVSGYSGAHFGLSMSTFTLGGTLAFGVGPLFITRYVDAFGLEAVPFAMLIGLSFMALIFKIVPQPREEGLRRYGFWGALRTALGAVWKTILLVWLVMVFRAFVTQSFLTFIPILFADEGYSLVSIGFIVSIFTVAGATSGLLAGHLADRIGYRPIFLFGHGLATPSLYLLLILPGKWVYLSVFMAGFFVMATIPLAVAMAQELAPKGKSMVSSLMMGLALGTGGMLTPLTGALADIFSIRTVLAFLSIIPLLTLALIARLPRDISSAKAEPTLNV